MELFNYITTTNIGLVWLATTTAILASKLTEKGMDKVLIKEILIYFLYSGLALLILIFLIIMMEAFINSIIELIF